MKSMDPQLDAVLDAYGRRAARRRRTKRSSVEVLSYTAAAGGLAFAGGDAMGAIQHFDTQLSVSAGTVGLLPPPVPWDIDGNGATDGLIFAGADSTTSGFLRPAINGGLQLVTDSANPGFAAKLPASFSMSAGVPVGAGPNFLLGKVFGGLIGNFVNTTGYVGFLFNDDPVGGGSDFFGWAKVRIDLDSVGPIRARTTVFEWAYEDVAGAPIHIADRATVPAPATPLLVLLGLGAAGVTAYRKRRKEGLARVAAEQGTAA